MTMFAAVRLLLAGKKLYLLAAAYTVYALIGLAVGMLDWNQAIAIIMESGLGATLRAAIAKG
jgi:hypothetical protein